jgi:hypothetical protein
MEEGGVGYELSSVADLEMPVCSIDVGNHQGSDGEGCWDRPRVVGNGDGVVGGDMAEESDTSSGQRHLGGVGGINEVVDAEARWWPSQLEAERVNVFGGVAAAAVVGIEDGARGGSGSDGD